MADQAVKTPPNIFIIGPQSTGKTTLVNALRKHFIREASNHANTVIPATIQEVARTVLEKHTFTRDDLTSSPERALKLQEHIIQAQLDAEMAIVNQSAPCWFISDRSGLDPIVYAHIFAGPDGSRGLMNTSTWARLKASMKTGRVFLCEAGGPWSVDDGVRLVSKDLEEWLKIDTTFRELLQAAEIEYALIPKDVINTDERVSMVLDVL